MQYFLKIFAVVAVSFFTFLRASADEFGYANMANFTGHNLFINTEDHRYFDEIIPFSFGPRFGEWAFWPAGSYIKFKQSRCSGQDCAGVWLVRMAIGDPNPVPDSQDIPLVWKLMSGYEAFGLVETAYIRPCFGGGECNTELTAHGIGIHMSTDWYVLMPWNSPSFTVGQLVSLPSTVK